MSAQTTTRTMMMNERRVSTAVTATTTTTATHYDADLRAERIAKYKEERRRQLATQFGSFSDNNQQQDSVPCRYITRAKNSTPNPNQTTTTTNVRTTRASRLRAAKINAPDAKRSSDQKEKSAASVSASSDTSCSSSSRTNLEKDKSAKRKSNLNRSLNTEDVPLTDLNDDFVTRRRRKRVLNPSDILASLNDSGLSSVRTTPPRTTVTSSSSSPRRTELSIHMENARRGVGVADSGLKNKPSNLVRRSAKGVEGASRTSDVVSKRMDELAALTKETLARVERLTNRSQEKFDDKKKFGSRSPDKGLKSTITTSRIVSDVKQTANAERLNGNVVIDHNGYHDDNAKPSSILKKKSLDEQQTIITPPTSVHALPVSILKRKSSQDEVSSSATPPPPVTFSPNVVDRKKPGILKKRSSLDESHVVRRRSYSPDVTLVDYKPILKTQRRSSLEEIIRTRSPDVPPSILKRKHSRGEDEFSGRSLGSPEPQSILKRKSGTSSSGSCSSSPHVSIAAAVILAAAGGAEIILEPGEHVKPILKKKSMSDEYPSLDSLSDAPKPILKKKSSTETDEQDERPMKPILKTSRKCSQDDNNWEMSDVNIESPRRHSVLKSRSESGSDCENVKPILKQSSSRENSPRPRLSFCNDEANNNNVSISKEITDSVVYRSKFVRVRRAHTVADVDDLSCMILNSQRSFDHGTLNVPERPVSVSEMVMNFEKNTGAIPKRSSLKGARLNGRFRTQPITFDELEATASLESVQSFQPRAAPPSPPPLSPSHREANSSSDLLSHSLDLTSSTYSSSLLSQNNDSQLTTPSSVPNESMDSGVASKIDDDGDISPKNENTQSPQELCRSSSVSAKASMFKQLEAHMKAVAEEAKATRLNRDVNKGIQRYRNKKQKATTSSSWENRFATQPVTLDEVQEAVRANQRTSGPGEINTSSQVKNIEEEGDESDPSNLSLSERVKLFNRKITDERLPIAPGGGPDGDIVRKLRRKTQPVTNEEVETAQKKISSLAASLIRPPDTQNLEGLSIRATKDKIYEHAAKMLTSEVRGILKTKSAISPVFATSPSPPLESNVEKPLKTILKKDRSPVRTNGHQKNKTGESSNNTNKIHELEKENLKDVELKLNKKNRCDILIKVDESDSKCNKVRRHLEEVQQMSSSTEGTSDAESSGGREVKKIIGNDAVTRRRQAALRQKEKNNSQLTKSKSHSSISREKSSTSCQLNRGLFLDPSTAHRNGTNESTDPVGFVRGGVRRSLTLPFRPGSADGNNMPAGGTIADRLAELQNSGNNEWRKRLPKLNTANDELIQLNSIVSKNLYNESLSSETVYVEKTSTSSTSILAARKDKLDAASHQWRKRVEGNDAVNFSVAGRMHQETKEILAFPLAAAVLGDSDKSKRTPKANRFRGREHVEEEVKPATISTPTSPQKELMLKFKRSVSAPGVTDEENDSDIESTPIKIENKIVPRPDDETFTTFFDSVTKSKSQPEILDLTKADLDSVTRDGDNLLVSKRTVKVQRKHVASARNPIKALAARSDIKEEYTEIIMGVAEREKKRLNIEKFAKHSSMAIEALAGLASREDFTAISLKKSTTNSNSGMLPYKDLMLLHVKGRRHVQTRLVEPLVSSINSGDNYVLVTPTQVYNYVGLYSNIIEQSRGAEVAMHIQQKKDLGCKCNDVVTIDEKKGKFTQLETFWKLLGSTPDAVVKEAGHPDEDEIYESAITETNMVYELDRDELVPVESYWGSIPKIEMLDSSKVLVFDFGTEMYVWSGRNVPLNERKLASKLAKELWESGYNYNDCAICPINGVSLLGNNSQCVQFEKNSNSRPDWALLGKITQHGETILFREKFLDWPDFSRVIKVKKHEDKSVDGSIVVKPCDAKAMHESTLHPPDLILEGSHLSRGVNYFDEELRRHFEITTLNVTAWHILEYDYESMPERSIGQFYNGDSYVIRWQYTISVTGRELSGKPSKHSMLGRDRCAYFCWQGTHAPLNEKGAAALLTVELDDERGPQVRVTQGSEPAAFLNLFDGSMVVHIGRRDSLKEEEEEEKPFKRLFMCRGDVKNEAHLVEVPCSMKQLRSRASFLLINNRTSSVIVWHGSKVWKNNRKFALKSALKLKETKPIEFNFTSDVNVTEEDEGNESKQFFDSIGGENRQLYCNLLKNLNTYEHTLRIFHLSSTSGVFKAIEIQCPHQSDDGRSAYPFIQQDLYSASQPALFLVDNHHELWLWQGWWPEVDSHSHAHSDSESESDRLCSDQTGSGQHRWQAERRAAMQTILDYWSGAADKVVPAYLVWAGLEPLEFTNLFPTWTDRDDIAEFNIKDGRKPGEILKVEIELARLTQSTYPLVQLLQRPLPDGVDPTHLEDYLSNEDFISLLGMSKPEFHKLPTWKQTNIKKETGLF